MIKCDWFWRLLKQWFFILLISCFGLLGGSFVNGYRVQQVWLQSMPSTQDSNYEITFLKWGWLLTNYLWQSKGFVAFDNSSFFWWASNWVPYFYDTNSIQWYFQEFWSCPEITWLDYSFNINSCSSQLITWDYVDLFKWFFSKVDNSDYVYYAFTPSYSNSSVNWSSRWNFITVCFSSDEIHSSLCFLRRFCSTSYAWGCSENYWHLTGSLNYSNLSFSSMSYNSYGPAPWQVGYAWIYEGTTEGSTTWNYNNIITWDYTYDFCTIWEIISELENAWFNKYMCYGWINNFDLYDSETNYSVIPWTWLRLSQILSYSNAWSSPQEWFDFWNWLYWDSKFDSMRSSYPAVYHTWFDIYSRYWNNKHFDWIREYCNMTVDLNLDRDSKYWWTVFKWVCETVIDKWRNPEAYGSWDYPKWVNWNGFGSTSWDSASDWITFIQDFFNLTKSNIATDYNWNAVWFLPKYIITFLLAVMLFKFLKH